MTINEATDIIIDIFDKVKQTDDEIIKSVKRLEIVLLNLKIENARIKTNTGIEPIADELNKSIKYIDEKISSLIKNNREELNQALDVIKNIK